VRSRIPEWNVPLDEYVGSTVAFDENGASGPCHGVKSTEYRERSTESVKPDGVVNQGKFDDR
jgi:hypothetical protein